MGIFFFQHKEINNNDDETNISINVMSHFHFQMLLLRN